MKVIDHIKKAKKPFTSFEITPPERGRKRDQLFQVMDSISKYNPPFIHVTSRASDVEYHEKEDGSYEKKIVRKRPGTLGISTAIKYKYGIDPVIHLLCKGFTREETEDMLIDLHDVGIENVLALQGDPKAYKKPIRKDRGVNRYAKDLVGQINDMNQGKYLEKLLGEDNERTSFCIGVGAYPEKHGRTPNTQTGMDHLKQKVDVGAEYAITQLFFNNEHYFRFIDEAAKQGINIPIIPGIKSVVKKAQLYSIPEIFRIEIPYELSEKLSSAKKEDVVKIGIEWTQMQVENLVNQKVPGVHFFLYEKEDVNSISQSLENLGFPK